MHKERSNWMVIINKVSVIFEVGVLFFQPLKIPPRRYSFAHYKQYVHQAINNLRVTHFPVSHTYDREISYGLKQ